jgi:hypothetical protein
MCVSHPLLLSFRSKELKEAWQNRHLEHEEDYYRDRNDYMGSRRLITYPW